MIIDEVGPTVAKGWGTDAPDQPLKPMEFERRALRPDDVAIKITYAGICHSDLHTVRNDWAGTPYPVIPGHEIVGKVTAVGPVADILSQADSGDGGILRPDGVRMLPSWSHVPGCTLFPDPMGEGVAP